MPRKRRKSAVSPLRIGLWAVAIVSIAMVVAWSLTRKIKIDLPAPIRNPADTAAPTPSSDSSSDAKTQAGDGVAMRKSGKLEIRKPARDAQLGVAADAAVLLRIVEMYQWHERCELSGGSCSYEASWSQGHVDSGKFRVPAGHLNPPAPFADARFAAGEIRLDGLIVDPRLLDGQGAQDFPVRESALPPNLEATFSVIDGALYAGGDAAHPQVGTVRVRYRIVAAGEVELSGVKRGNRLEPK